MGLEANRRPAERLDPEKVAYWYFRLNGFLQIENFVVHPTRRGGQRTDADIIAARFPHRAEFLFDDANRIMADDHVGISLSYDRIDVVIAEVKTNQQCTLNGPWTREDQQNVHRVLAAIGCLPRAEIGQAAVAIYSRGLYENAEGVRICLVAIGREPGAELAAAYPAVVQLTWQRLARFMWQRFRDYRQQKTQVNQWDEQGRRIKRLADQSDDAEEFIAEVLQSMGVSHK